MATLSEPTRPSWGRNADRVAGRERRRVDSPWSSWPTTRHTSTGEVDLVQRLRVVGELDADDPVAGRPGLGRGRRRRYRRRST